ncbi:MAG: DUF1566 domain-containing protein [Polyangia bacterium]
MSPLSSGGYSGNDGTGGMGGATAGSGGTPGSGGISGTGGAAGSSSSAYGMPCATDQDCPSDATCCDGSDEGCDGTRLPAGDGVNSGEFVVGADGLTVTDTITGLVWQRDGSGARSGCGGSGNLTCTSAEAKAYCASLTLSGQSVWRLPGVMELVTLVDFTAENPTIDQTVFPNTPSDYFWASSAVADSSGYTWSVSFGYGDSDVIFSADQDFRVRCVRGSRCYPTSRFVVLDGGLAHDTLTNLEWQQEASGTTMSWADAQTYCSSAGAGLRLPTVKELRSIVDYAANTAGSSIDPTAFPNTPSDLFWTSSPSTDASGQWWWVSFSSGESSSNGGGPFWVRCVR